MGLANAEMFSLLTESLCHHYEIPFMLSEVQSDVIYVKEEEFCYLVERVMNSAYFVLYSWAQVAAGLYEAIKGTKYQWLWPERNTPHKPFLPFRESGCAPNDESDETIGRFDFV
jgi:hypothetical protein